VAYGDQRERVCVMINIDMEAAGNWAERHNLPYAGYTDLAQKSEVYALIQECVEKVNADLSVDELLAGSQISRFLVLHKELDADDGELTRTNKVRRGFIAEKYAPLIDALYGGKSEQFIETPRPITRASTPSPPLMLPISNLLTQRSSDLLVLLRSLRRLNSHNGAISERIGLTSPSNPVVVSEHASIIALAFTHRDPGWVLTSWNSIWIVASALGGPI